jgi:L-rhamnose mutarotase
MTLTPDARPEYFLAHKQVAPEMIEALARYGWRNYSLFTESPEHVVGYFEAEDPARAMSDMRDDPANIAWQRRMRPFLAGGDGSLILLSEYFNLEDQLTRLQGPVN